MNDVKKPAGDRTLCLVKALYVISAVIAVIFVYMVIVNVLYMKNYLAAYAMTFSDMWMDVVQYVITGSISYFVYSILMFCLGKIISMLYGKADGKIDEKVGEAEEAEKIDIPESEDAIEKTEVIVPKKQRKKPRA